MNLFLQLLIVLFEDKVPKGSMRFGMETLKEVYPNLSEEDILALGHESWYNQEFKYEPYIQFTRKAKEGKFLNIHEEGFRYIQDQCSYPLNRSNYNIFLFGGSTAFGYGIGDNDTIASRIQYRLRNNYNFTSVCVYNFGIGAYFSIQEGILLQNLIRKNQIPDMSIYLDLLNDYNAPDSQPKFTPQLSGYMAGKNKVANALSELPMARIAAYLLSSGDNRLIKGEKELIDITNRYFINKKIIESVSNNFGIKTYFVVQPIPLYKYNLSNHIVYNKYPHILNISMNGKLGYEILRGRYDNLSFNDRKNIIWLADMQENRSENLYVDSDHYNPYFSDEIAKEIVKSIKNSIHPRQIAGK
ncbi:hypothetical protein HYW19_02015 [Candidatus Woesearchaeota archaeon]|nr:hypothetical protein [Candidatus Woesearchaeota archaeon]